MVDYREIAELTMEALRAGEYQMADQFLQKMLYGSNPEAAKEILSEQNMVLKILTEILLCERNRGRGEDTFKVFDRSYETFFRCYQRVKRMIRRIWFGFVKEQQKEINDLLRKEPVSSDMLAVIAKYSVPKELWGDLFRRLSGLLKEDHPEIAWDIDDLLGWLQREKLLGTGKCCSARKRTRSFSYRRLTYQREEALSEPAPGISEKKLAVIFCSNDDEYAEECRAYLDYLILPEGFQGEILEIREAPGMAAGYNYAMRSTDAKYKLYIHHDTLLIDENVPEKLIRAFEEDKMTGLIGVFGSTVLPESGRWYQAPYEKSVLSLYQDAILSFLYPKKESEAELRDAEAADGAFLATAYDIGWREDLFDHWHFYDIAECCEMKKSGFSVKLFADQKPWILHESTLRKDPEDNYGRYCRIFLKNYQNRG